ncbi:hypothetical protein E2C01_090493 [Portunus trituberculatus]|uniref:Uncharacterized protein n=1 Tax=Portunus trituberculatus TaxID=210409 RepID=A0A5B7JEU8_PORTR|nr:hypothetical protein [Portunus trituberculatus]
MVRTPCRPSLFPSGLASINHSHKQGLGGRPFRVGGACRQHQDRDVRRHRPVKAERRQAVYRCRHPAGHSTWARFSRKDQGHGGQRATGGEAGVVEDDCEEEKPGVVVVVVVVMERQI